VQLITVVEGVFWRLTSFEMVLVRATSSHQRGEVDQYFSSIRLQDDVEIALKSVGQALLWACSLLEYYTKNLNGYMEFRDNDKASGVVKGIRYARNRVLHQFIQLLHITGGATLPAILPAPFFEIEWKPFEELPEPDKGFKNEELAESYRNHLENTPVRFTFDELSSFFRRLNEAKIN